MRPVVSGGDGSFTWTPTCGRTELPRAHGLGGSSTMAHNVLGAPNRLDRFVGKLRPVTAPASRPRCPDQGRLGRGAHAPSGRPQAQYDATSLLVAAIPRQAELAGKMLEPRSLRPVSHNQESRGG